MGSLICRCWRRTKPYVLVIFLQFGLAVLAMISKFALNQGLNHYSFVVYRHAIATAVMTPFALICERKVRPKMTLKIFGKIMLLGFLDPVLGQNLSYVGLKYTSATFITTLNNMLPALAFIMAWIFRLEKVNLRKIRSQAKVGGTVVTIGGVLLMTMVKGPMIGLPWTKESHNHYTAAHVVGLHDQIKGALLFSIGGIGWACFIILQATTLVSYPAELTLTALICAAATVEGLVLTLAMEWGNTSIWALGFDSKLLTCVYSGVVCSGLAYYIQGVIMKEKGPVFVAVFNPLRLIIVAVLGSFILSEQLFVGSVIGATVIVVGVYFVIWGKSKDVVDGSSTKNSEPILPLESKQITADKNQPLESKQITADKNQG